MLIRILAPLALILPLAAQTPQFPQFPPAPPAPAGEARPPGEGQPRRAEEPPKNLKILKAEELMPAMRSYTAGLGVRCDFCHVQGDRASDANPHKNEAREMIAMTRQINSHFPDGKERVTCYTCHRGEHEPRTAPPPPVAPASVSPAAAPPPSPAP